MGQYSLFYIKSILFDLSLLISKYLRISGDVTAISTFQRDATIFYDRKEMYMKGYNIAAHLPIHVPALSNSMHE